MRGELSARDMGEASLRAAFERLKNNSPMYLPLGVPVTQNNVAREAGLTPSALRKERYAELIEEIRQYKLKRKVLLCPEKSATMTHANVVQKNYDLSRVLSLLAEIAELRRKVLYLESELRKQRGY